MEISFNVGSAQFTRIQNLGELIVGNNYLTRRRLPGLRSYDLIGRYTGMVDGNPHFDLIYKRARRVDDHLAYNEWVPYRIDPYERPDPSIVSVDEFIPVGDIGIGIFYLGENGELITPTTSPDMASDIVLARREALHKTGLPPDLTNEIGKFLGGKRTTSKKSRRTRKSRRTTSKKYRRSTSRSFK